MMITVDRAGVSEPIKTMETPHNYKGPISAAVLVFPSPTENDNHPIPATVSSTLHTAVARPHRPDDNGPLCPRGADVDPRAVPTRRGPAPVLKHSFVLRGRCV